jgi:hypothetical protein
MPSLYDPGNTKREKFHKLWTIVGTSSATLGWTARIASRSWLFQGSDSQQRRLRRYLRQKAGVNSTSTLKISRRPRTMASVQTQV